MDPVYVGGIGVTRFGVLDPGLLALLHEATALALADAEAPEALFIGSMSPEVLGGVSNLGSAAAHALGLSGAPAIRVDTASSSGAAVLAVAASAVASGHYRRVLAVAGEKMTGIPTPEVTRILAEVIDEDEREIGLTMPAMAALVARAYAHHERLDEERLKELLAQIALKAHTNGALNPRAHFQKPITLDAYLSGRPVADPLSVFDCAPISDGAAAVVLTSEPTDVRLAGIGQGTDTPSLSARFTLSGFPATVHAAQKAYRMAGFGPRDVDVAEVHDAFTIFELTGMSDLGLFEEREALDAVEAGETGLGGRLPVNPSGGLKARGHPVGASGLAQIVEVTSQLRGIAEPGRQVERVRRALTHSIGGPGSNNFVVLLERPDAEGFATAVPGVPLPKNGHGGRTSDPRDSVLAAEDAPLYQVGRVQSYTTLHTPAAGFPAPLTLVLTGQRGGGGVLATAPSAAGLRVGGRVSVSSETGQPVARPLPPRKLSLRWMLAGASRARRRFLRRPPMAAR